ncbi:MAG: AAA family ATPase [Candidatus Sedimenticola sp. (ex Thyasira tokunagai)]
MGEPALAQIDKELGIETDAREYPLIWIGDAVPQIDSSAIIQDVFKPESMIVTYGESNSGKTFHVLDQDICIASGRKWFDKHTEKSMVIYAAAEGPHSVQNRVYAYRQEILGDIPASFALLPYPLNLFNPTADVYPLVDFVRCQEDERGEKCGKITIDTLARAMAGGNENSPEDMGQLVRHADILRQEIGCCVHFVHHSGKDTAKGARGHSSLRAATDTEIEVRNDNGLHIAKVTKQRDWAIGDEYAFRLKVVELGEDLHGSKVTTCVPEWELDHQTTEPRKRLTQQENLALTLMKEVISETKMRPPVHLTNNRSNRLKVGQFACPVRLWRDRCKARKLSDTDKADSQDRTFRRAIKSLQAKEKIQVFEDWAWLTD